MRYTNLVHDRHVFPRYPSQADEVAADEGVRLGPPEASVEGSGCCRI